MEKNWYIVNRELLSLEAVPEEARDQDWIKKWDGLIELSRTIAGCIKREKYDKQTPEKGTEEGRKRATVPDISGYLAEEKAPLRGEWEVVGEGGTDSVLSPHLAQI